MQTIYQKMETTELDAAIEALKAEDRKSVV